MPTARQALPPHNVRAHNAATASENKIHDDAVARRHGFAGGLVPGITVFGYLTRPVVETWGSEWLERGCACKDSKAAAFCANVLALEPALWTFTRKAGVEPTNNHIERLLRLYEVRRKAGDKPGAALKETLSVVLASPMFLYLAEPSRVR